MLILELKVKAKEAQYAAIDEAIRTSQFVRNKALRYWMDTPKVTKYDLNKYCAVLAKEFDFANKLNSTARQASAERAWSGIARFYDNCKRGVARKGYPKFKKNSHSVEYKHSGWKLSGDRKSITFTDGNHIGRLKLVGTRDLSFYSIELIKRVRLVKRADGYYCQFAISIDRVETAEPTGRTLGLDVGLNQFYTDSTGHQEPNPRFYRKGEAALKRAHRSISRKQKGSRNRAKARNRFARKHLKISRQRIEHAKRLARCVIQSNDLVAYEDLRVQNMKQNHCLAKSMSDAGWFQFRVWLEYFGKILGRVTVAVPPQYTSQACSSCGSIVHKSLSTRTHSCQCGATLDRDHNAAINILKLGLSTVGHTGTHAWGDLTATPVGENLSEQVESLNQESPALTACRLAVGVSMDYRGHSRSFKVEMVSPYVAMNPIEYS